MGRVIAKLPLVPFVIINLTRLTAGVCKKVRFKSKVTRGFSLLAASRLVFVAFGFVASRLVFVSLRGSLAAQEKPLGPGDKTSVNGANSPGLLRTTFIQTIKSHRDIYFHVRDYRMYLCSGCFFQARIMVMFFFKSKCFFCIEWLINNHSVEAPTMSPDQFRSIKSGLFNLTEGSKFLRHFNFQDFFFCGN